MSKLLPFSGSQAPDLLSGKEESASTVASLRVRQTYLETYSRLLKCMMHIPFAVLFRRKPLPRRSLDLPCWRPEPLQRAHRARLQLRTPATPFFLKRPTSIRRDLHTGLPSCLAVGLDNLVGGGRVTREVLCTRKKEKKHKFLPIQLEAGQI